jgi:EmrB/QacA subfamily drug resistance transporter
MSQNAVQVALPPIMTAFGLNIDQAQWLVTGYMIAGAILVPAVGWLGNRLGNRTLYVLSLLTFLTGSTLCAFAWSGPSLIVFRVLQGLGGGPIMPMTMALLAGTFPPEQRGIAVGIMGIGIAFGPGVGPVLGGYLTEYLSWRMVFLLVLAPGLVGVVLTILVLPNTREAQQRSLDVIGLLVICVFLVSLLVALSRGQREGWDSPFIQRLFIIAAVALVIFLVRETYAQEPLIDLRIYANITFSAVSVLVLIFFMNFMISLFLQTILLQRLLDYTPARAGYVLLPGALFVAVAFPIAGRLADVFDRRLIMFCALSVFALASYEFTGLSLERPLSWMMWIAGLRFVAGSFFFTSATAAALSHLPPEQVRMGSGLLNLVQQGIGGTIGLAVGTTVLQRRITVHSSLLDQQQVSSALGWDEVLTPVRELVQQAGSLGHLGEAQVQALVHHHLSQQATVAAYQDCYMLVMVLCLASMPMLLLLRSPSDKRRVNQ